MTSHCVSQCDSKDLDPKYATVIEFEAFRLDNLIDRKFFPDLDDAARENI